MCTKDKNDTLLLSRPSRRLAAALLHTDSKIIIWQQSSCALKKMRSTRRRGSLRFYWKKKRCLCAGALFPETENLSAMFLHQYKWIQFDGSLSSPLLSKPVDRSTYPCSTSMSTVEVWETFRKRSSHATWSFCWLLARCVHRTTQSSIMILTLSILTLQTYHAYVSVLKNDLQIIVSWSVWSQKLLKLLTDDLTASFNLVPSEHRARLSFPHCYWIETDRETQHESLQRNTERKIKCMSASSKCLSRASMCCLLAWSCGLHLELIFYTSPCVITLYWNLSWGQHVFLATKTPQNRVDDQNGCAADQVF